MEQAEREERIAAGTLSEPIDERGRSDVVEGRSGQLRECNRIQRQQVEPPQRTVLLQPQQYRQRVPVLSELDRPCRDNDEYTGLSKGAGQVPKSLPRGDVRKVRVVQKDNNRSTPREVRDDDGKPLEQA